MSAVGAPGQPDHQKAIWSRATGRQRVQDLVMACFFTSCTVLTVLTTVGIIGVLGWEGIRFFHLSGISPFDFLTGTRQNFEDPPVQFGILPLIWGTFLIAGGSSLIALPIGLLSAIYLSEYAPRKMRAVLKPALELLAGIPTIVYGYLALLLVTPGLIAVFTPMGVKVDYFNALSAGIVVGIMIIPMVSSLSEDVLSAVPRSLREAGYALGATKHEISLKVVLPAGLSGVIASFILAVSRAVGETMAVVLAAGSQPNLLLNPLKSVETMTAYIVAVTRGEAATGSLEYLSLFAVGLALLAITLVFNILSLLIMKRYREIYH